MEKNIKSVLNRGPLNVVKLCRIMNIYIQKDFQWLQKMTIKLKVTANMQVFKQNAITSRAQIFKYSDF